MKRIFIPVFALLLGLSSCQESADLSPRTHTDYMTINYKDYGLAIGQTKEEVQALFTQRLQAVKAFQKEGCDRFIFPENDVLIEGDDFEFAHVPTLQLTFKDNRLSGFEVNYFLGIDLRISEAQKTAAILNQQNLPASSVQSILKDLLEKHSFVQLDEDVTTQYELSQDADGLKLTYRLEKRGAFDQVALLQE